VRARARYLVPCTAILLLGFTAGGSSSAPDPGGSLASLASAQRSAELELFAAESALARARVWAAELERRRQALDARLVRARQHVAVVRRSLAATNDRVATLLRRLYVEGDADPIAVLLGARSLPAMLAGIDELERATLANRGLAAELRSRSRWLQDELGRLGRARHELVAAEREADAAAAAREHAAAARRSTIESIRRRAHATNARLAGIEARARAAQRAASRLTPAGRPAPVPATPGAPSAPSAPPATQRLPSSPTTPAAAGTRTLVVDAVAYHLSGRTASGLPVGVGVIAGAPAVMPLGTRVFVPGYGAAVAADVGSAIRGNIIDLWMPSTAAARAWGRRTVTITVYG
jgi:3D (Asp-Asp-Asp) domain-containing protein